MTSARTSKSPIARWTFFIAILTVAALTYVSAVPDANAQSVRPPSNAVNTDTGSSELEGGNVPGGSMGVTSDADIWRKVRKGVVGTVSIPDTKAATLVQSEGESFRAIRNGPLPKYGVYGMAGIIALLALFFLVRGRIRIDAGPSSTTVTRFDDLERMGHWLLAVSFIILGLTGLFMTYGKYILLGGVSSSAAATPAGSAAFSAIASTGKWLHNFVAFAFMAALVWVLVAWIRHNLPSKYDLIWLAKGGGMFTKGSHPPAKKFNAGQKILFWLIILGGFSISLSGLSLLFPFEMPLFAKTFGILNGFGLNLPTELTAIEEMQLANIWHVSVAFFLICVVIAHIYIGTLGMEGAFDAMGSGEVDANWAKEHHSIWYKEEMAKGHMGHKKADPSATAPLPAE